MKNIETVGKFKISKTSKNSDEICYLEFPNHPKETVKGCVKKSLRLVEEMPGYVGPDIILDYDENNALIGIEILI